VAAFDFAIDLRTAGRDVSMEDAEIPKMPREVGAELVAMAGLEALNGHGQPLADLIDEGNGVRDGIVGVDLENAIPGGLVHGGELVEPAAAELEVLHVDLDGLARYRELPSPPRPGRYRFIETRGTPCRLRIL
jgi:hypothetical protein